MELDELKNLNPQQGDVIEYRSNAPADRRHPIKLGYYDDIIETDHSLKSPDAPPLPYVRIGSPARNENGGNPACQYISLESIVRLFKKERDSKPESS